MVFRKSSKLNTTATKQAFLLLSLVMLFSVLFALPAYAETDTVSPAIPSGFEAKSGVGLISLIWSANGELDLGGYNIYRDTTSTTTTAILASVGKDVTSYEDTSAVLGTTYYYWLSAVDTATNESGKAGYVSATARERERVSFKDITNAHWARSYIEELLENGIITGYADSSFRPESNVTRAEFAKMVSQIMVSRAVWSLTTETTASFSDVDKTHWASSYIETAKKYGVMTGYKNGDKIEFRPDKNITRAEIAKIISTLLKLERGESKLKDVSTHWAKEHVNSCVKAGIVSGYANGNFEPSSFATRSQVCKMLVKMMKLLDVQKKSNKDNKGKNAGK